MKKLLSKGILAFGILTVGIFGVAGAASAGFPTQHSISIDKGQPIIKLLGFPTQH